VGRSLGSVRALTRGVAAGNPEAVEALYNGRFDVVYRAARRAGFDEHRSLDIVQDVFIKAVRAMPVIETSEQLDAWLRRVALRTALDALRAERRRTRREQSSGDQRAPTRDERLDAVRRELAALDADAIELLQLRHQAGLTLDAIARLFGLSVGAVDGRLRRAARVLRQRIEEQS